MAEPIQDEMNIRDLPDEIKLNILDKLNDDDLIRQTAVPGFRYIAFKLLKKRLDKLSIRNLIRLYRFRDLRVAVGQYYTQCLLLLKYKRIKEIYENETDQTVKDAIEARIAENFVEVAGQEIPPNINVIKQIDTIRSIIFADNFVQLVETNGGPFNAFAALKQPEQRIMTSGIIDMVNRDHTYSLDISVGLTPNNCRLSRGGHIERDIECDFNTIFQRLFDSIQNNYSFKNMIISTQTIGNNQIGPMNEQFNI
jgi:hypothetical protein